jgi:hypothetical protein
MNTDPKSTDPKSTDPMSGEHAIPAAPPVLNGERVYRIHWVLLTDSLRAVCFCGAERIFEDPIELWEWLLGHPEGHDAGPAAGAPAPSDRSSDRSSDFVPA